MTRIAVDGICLNVESCGQRPDERRPPLVLLHGFTGSAAGWAPCAASFGYLREVHAIDLPGHGASDSPPDPARYRLERTVEDLLRLFDALGLERVDLLGYSMGGRVALRLALAAPKRVSTLILESASPGISDPVEREARLRSDAELANSIERDGLEAFADRWERQPLFASRARLDPTTRAAVRAHILSNSPLGLGNSLRGAGAAVAGPLFDRLGELRMPVLLIVGELDARYCALGRGMGELMPAARLEIVPHAGHTVHLEQPDAFEWLVLGFLEERSNA
jgi:2-succinyl-6-hydroxy-2,4-cyclohexadiene-1-carboxylate synthase